VTEFSNGTEAAALASEATERKKKKGLIRCGVALIALSVVLVIAEPYINPDKSLEFLYNGRVVYAPTSIILERLNLSALRNTSLMKDPSYIYLKQKGEAREFRMEIIFGVAFVTGLIGFFVFLRAFRG
jgi:hypothetical protein